MPRHSVVDAALRDAVASGEDALRRAYGRALSRVSRTMASSLPERASSLTAAGWVVPDADELARIDKLAEQVRAETDPIRRRVIVDAMTSALAAYGVSFDAANPLVSGLLETLGTHITRIAEDQRSAMMRELQAAYAEGESIPQAASRLRSVGAQLAGRRSVTIARTEIVGASNGASLGVARLAGVAAYKQWLTAPGAEHPRHEDYDDLDGQTVPIDARFDVGGALLQYPGDQDGPPEEVINCRCTLSYVDSLVAAGEEATMPDLPEYPRAVTGRVSRLSLTAAADGRTGVEGVLMFVDTPTGDGRRWAGDGMTIRPLPLPLQAMFEDDHGSGAPLTSVNVGQIDDVSVDGAEVRFSGTLNDDPDTGLRAAAAIEAGDLPGISVDTAPSLWEVTYPAAGDAMDDETMMDLMLGENAEPVTVTEGVDDMPQVVFTAWEMLGGTFVPHPAFANARAEIRRPASMAASADVERASAALEAATLPERVRSVERLYELKIISRAEARAMIGITPDVDLPDESPPAERSELAETMTRIAASAERGESQSSAMMEMLARLRGTKEIVTKRTDADGNVQYVKTYEPMEA